MGEFKNEFSWSKSRDETFKECLRKYYLNCYGFWGGWDINAPKRLRDIYTLKQLISKEIWVGQVVHDLISHFLEQVKKGNLLSLGNLQARLKKTLTEDFISSENKLYIKYPKHKCGLFEHEYGREISTKEKEKLFELAERCITNFYNSDVFNEIKKTNPENWVIIESLLESNPTMPQSFEFEGTKIWLKIDFAIKDEKSMIIYDWKTGKERETEMDLQLACYSIYAMQKWSLKPEQIVIKRYNLAIDKCDQFSISDEQIKQIKDNMKESIGKMRELLKDEINNIAEEEKFLKTKNEWTCGRCNFKRIC